MVLPLALWAAPFLVALSACLRTQPPFPEAVIFHSDTNPLENTEWQWLRLEAPTHPPPFGLLTF